LFLQSFDDDDDDDDDELLLSLAERDEIITAFLLERVCVVEATKDDGTVAARVMLQKHAGQYVHRLSGISVSLTQGKISIYIKLRHRDCSSTLILAVCLNLWFFYHHSTLLAYP